MQDYLRNNYYDVNQAINATGGGYQLPYSADRVRQESMARQQQASGGGLSLSGVGNAVMDYYGAGGGQGGGGGGDAAAVQADGSAMQAQTGAAGSAYEQFATDPNQGEKDKGGGLLGGLTEDGLIKGIISAIL